MNKQNNNQKNNKANQSQARPKKRRPRNQTITQRFVLGGIPQQPKPSRAYRNLMSRYHQTLYRYMRSLFFPEDAVNGSFSAKQPSFTSIPTTTIAFKEQAYFRTSSDGSFNLIWIPNFFATRASIEKHLQSSTNPLRVTQYGHLYIDNSSTVDNPGVFKLHTSYAPLIALAKYRLVSAKLVVEYNGQAIQKGGNLQSCALYNDLPVVLQWTSPGSEDSDLISSTLNAELLQYTDVELIRNGLWNNFVNLSDITHNKIEMLALPTDPTDATFYPMCHYYSKEPEQVKDGDEVVQACKAAKSSDGGHLSYVVKGTNILSSTSDTLQMVATAYYNFEIIADQSTAPFLRSKGRSAEDYWFAQIFEQFKGPISDAVREANMKGQSIDIGLLAEKLFSDFGLSGYMSNPLIGKPLIKEFVKFVKSIGGSSANYNMKGPLLIGAGLSD